MLSAMAQDHERATGPWQSEQLALPQIFVLTSGALMYAAAIAEGMTVDTKRMRENLDSTHGLILAEAVMMAAAKAIGRDKAHHVVEHAAAKAIAEKRPLGAILKEDKELTAHLSAAEIDRALDPAGYIGESLAVVDRVAARARKELAGGKRAG
jgi:3-carboxy-cis,cis-muconate cycloisomerase